MVVHHLFGPVLRVGGEIVEGVVSLSDPTEQHSHYAWWTADIEWSHFSINPTHWIILYQRTIIKNHHSFQDVAKWVSKNIKIHLTEVAMVKCNGRFLKWNCNVKKGAVKHNPVFWHHVAWVCVSVCLMILFEQVWMIHPSLLDQSWLHCFNVTVVTPKIRKCFMRMRTGWKGHFQYVIEIHFWLN